MIKWILILISLHVVITICGTVYLTHSAQHKIKEHRLMKPPIVPPGGSIYARDRSYAWPMD
jgi:hypothetical protein